MEISPPFMKALNCNKTEKTVTTACMHICMLGVLQYCDLAACAPSWVQVLHSSCKVRKKKENARRDHQQYRRMTHGAGKRKK